ncbi:MAG: hypothetical protein Unbinned2250contig1000_6 [Prokaryotic dsDNA virus sp.]|nr:MAG: hypothetical protein Unbinned2250contig1000_6 [Prokaryotic dsDNA virus sp.]|tara:strand:+ start:2204 stop:2614 length:411 start_codon:yes stop_codon:yes gene_type:complete
MVQLTQGTNTLYLNVSDYKSVGTSPVYKIRLTDEATENSIYFTLNIAISEGGWNGRRLKGQINVNDTALEDKPFGIIHLKQPQFLEGFYQMNIYEETVKTTLIGKNLAHLERSAGEDGYNRFESYEDRVTYKAYEE